MREARGYLAIWGQTRPPVGELRGMNRGHDHEGGYGSGAVWLSISIAFDARNARILRILGVTSRREIGAAAFTSEFARGITPRPRRRLLVKKKNGSRELRRQGYNKRKNLTI